MNETLFRTLDSPVGTITVAGDGTTVAHLRMTEQTHAPAGQEAWRHEPAAFVDAVDQLRAYFDGALTEFDRDAGVPVRAAGLREFGRRSWFTYPSQANFIFTEPKNARGESGPAVRKITLASRESAVRSISAHKAASWSALIQSWESRSTKRCSDWAGWRRK